MSAMSEFIWTPQDLGALAGIGLARSGYSAYAVATKFADKRTGLFQLPKSRAAANMSCSKRTADRGFAELGKHGIVEFVEQPVRSGRQQANVWRLNPRYLWRLAAISVRAKLDLILQKLEARRVARRERLQLLNGVKTAVAVPQAFISEQEIREFVARNARQQGYGLDYERQEREVEALLSGGGVDC